MTNHSDHDLIIKIDQQMSYLVEKVDSIEAQTKKTNGRVSKAEMQIQGFNMSKRFFIWSFGAVWSVVLLIIPITYWVTVQIITYEIETQRNEIRYEIDEKMAEQISSIKTILDQTEFELYK